MATRGRILPRISFGNAGDADALRQSEMRLYFRRPIKFLWLGGILLLLEMVFEFLFSPVFVGAFNSQLLEMAWFYREMLGAIQNNLFRAGGWLSAGVSFWALQREWNSGRGKELAVTSLRCEELFRAKFQPLLLFLMTFVGLALIYLTIDFALFCSSLLAQGNQYFDKELITELVQGMVSSSFVELTTSAWILPLFVWYGMLKAGNNKRDRLLSVPISVISLTLIAGLYGYLTSLELRALIRYPIVEFLPLQHAALRIVLIFVLARYVAAHFRKLLLVEEG